jgi:hypothetical protein
MLFLKKSTGLLGLAEFGVVGLRTGNSEALLISSDVNAFGGILPRK